MFLIACYFERSYPAVDDKRACTCVVLRREADRFNSLSMRTIMHYGAVTAAKKAMLIQRIQLIYKYNPQLQYL